MAPTAMAIPYVCYAARPNSFVIRANGSLSKCTVAFGDIRNNIGKLNEDGTLTIENHKMQKFMRGFQSLDPGELHCPMHNMETAQEVHPITIVPRQTPSAAESSA
jgi:uncharacterized protein